LSSTYIFSRISLSASLNIYFHDGPQTDQHSAQHTRPSSGTKHEQKDFNGPSTELVAKELEKEKENNIILAFVIRENETKNHFGLKTPNYDTGVLKENFYFFLSERVCSFEQKSKRNGSVLANRLK